MRVKGGDFLTLGEYLALHHQEPFTASGVLDALNADRTKKQMIGRSTFQYWLRQLRWHGAVQLVEDGYSIDIECLLALLAAHRKVQLAPVAEFTIDCTAATLSRRLKRSNTPHALGILSAAETWGAKATLHPIHLYAPRSDIATLSTSFEGDDHEVQVFAQNVDDLEDLHVKLENGVALTCPFVTLLDCLAHPHGKAHAQYMRQVFDAHDPTA